MAGTSPSTVFDPTFATALAGTHRLQSVSKGKRQTSSVTVVAMDGEPGSGVRLQAADVTEEFLKGSGAGGQNRNKRETAVRLTHFPTGITTYCADQRTQGQNRAAAWARLKERVTEESQNSFQDQQNAERLEALEDTPVWSWCEWRDEVKSPSGTKKSMKRTLKGRMGWIQ